MSRRSCCKTKHGELNLVHILDGWKRRALERSGARASDHCWKWEVRVNDSSTTAKDHKPHPSIFPQPLTRASCAGCGENMFTQARGEERMSDYPHRLVRKSITYDGPIAGDSNLFASIGDRCR